MMSNCDICEILNHKDEFRLVYEDEMAFALLHENPAMLGHILVIPRKHFRIIEEVPDDVISHLFTISNILSSAIFDTLGAHGTNIIVNNGVAAGQELPHFMIHVVPRRENDGMNFEWPPKKAPDSELSSAQGMLEAVVDEVFLGKGGNVIKKNVKEKVMTVDGEDNYLLKELVKIP